MDIKSSESIILDAQNHIRKGEMSKANQILVAEVRKNPENAPAWYLLSFSLNDTEKQIKALNRALAIAPSMREALARKNQLINNSIINEFQDPFETKTNEKTRKHPSSSPSKSRSKSSMNIKRFIAVLTISLFLIVGVILVWNLTINNGQISFTANLPYEAQTALAQYLAENVDRAGYNIASAMQSTQPSAFAGLFSTNSYEEAWCVIVTPPQTLSLRYRDATISAFAVGRSGLLWQVINGYAHGVEDDRQIWLRAGCSNWDEAILQVVSPNTDSEHDLLLSLVPGTYEVYDTTMDLVGDTRQGRAILHRVIGEDRNGTYTIVGDRVILDELDFQLNGEYVISYDAERGEIHLNGRLGGYIPGKRDTESSIQLNGTYAAIANATFEVQSTQAAITAETRATENAILHPTQTQRAIQNIAFNATKQAVEKSVDNLTSFFLDIQDNLGETRFSFEANQASVFFLVHKNTRVEFRAHYHGGDTSLLENEVELYDSTGNRIQLSFRPDYAGLFSGDIQNTGIYQIILRPNSKTESTAIIRLTMQTECTIPSCSETEN